MAIKNIELDEKVYRDYANKFWNELTATLWSNKDAFEFIPIVFTTSELYSESGSKVLGVTHMHTNMATNISTIYPVVYISDTRSSEDIKSTIRHEIIHYFLGVLYKCHNDTSALFWLICDCFNGNAYSPMTDKSRKIYDHARPYIRQIFDIYRLTSAEKAAINFSLMLTIIDETESEQSPDYNKLELNLKLCVEAANR